MKKSDILLNNALSLHNSGDIQGALSTYQQIVAEFPTNAEAWHGMGILSLQIGRFDLAEKFISEAIKNRKREAAYFNNLGLAQHNLGKTTEAIKSFEKSIKYKPGYVEAMNNLGTVFLNLENYDKAISLFERILRINPKYSNALNNLGNAFQKNNQLNEAIEAYQRTIKLDPSKVDTYSNLAAAYRDLGDFEQAIHYANESINHGAQGSSLANTLNTLGIAYKQYGMFSEADKAFNQALQIDPCSIDAHLNFGLLKLVKGDLADGWDDYAWRLKQVDVQRHSQHFLQPLWQGEDLSGKNLVVWAEQGLGDEILFANMFHDVIDSAENCIIECDRRLLPIFSRSFPRAEFLARTNPPSSKLMNDSIHFQSPAGSLATFVRSDLEAFPSEAGYLSADPARVEFWKNELAKISNKPKIGLCWRSMLKSAERSKHYSAIIQWKRILQSNGVTFINLQYDNCEDELAEIQEKLGVTIHNMGIDLLNDLDEAAALTAALDLVISAATSVSAMSGALGQETLLLTLADNWTMLGTDHIPWYPNTRMIVKQPGQPWQEVLDRIAEELPA